MIAVLTAAEGDGEQAAAGQHWCVLTRFFCTFYAGISLIFSHFRPFLTHSRSTGCPSASGPTLDGQTIEFEWCTASRGGLRSCIAELEGQHATSKAEGAGRTPLSVMWLTDAKALPAETQCSELRSLQASMPWLLAGLDRSDLTWP